MAPYTSSSTSATAGSYRRRDAALTPPNVTPDHDDRPLHMTTHTAAHPLAAAPRHPQITAEVDRLRTWVRVLAITLAAVVLIGVYIALNTVHVPGLTVPTVTGTVELGGSWIFRP